MIVDTGTSVFLYADVITASFAVNPYDNSVVKNGSLRISIKEDFDILIISPTTATLSVTTGKNI